MQWARANGCAWNSITCSRAAMGGHLDVLKWARSNGCEWDSTACAFAANGGHLDVLRWLRLGGCEWGSTACVGAGRDDGACGARPRLECHRAWAALLRHADAHRLLLLLAAAVPELVSGSSQPLVEVERRERRG